MVVESMNGHVGKVNDFDVGFNVMVSVGIDKNMIVWNLESKFKIDKVVLNGVGNVVRFTDD